MKSKVYVGLSGGVDSATAAGMLKEQGYDVVGIFIRIWQPEFLECTWRDDRLDAMRSAATLGIPFEEIDLSKEYQEHVLQVTLDAYRSGSTPNPDVLCNQSIKFGFLLQYIRARGGEYIATGHYARKMEKNGQLYVQRAVDTNKDQSYFLSRLGQDELQSALFPLGELTKTEVREKARALGLPVADKPDSQGLCFVGDISMKDFISRFIDVSKGRVLNDAGTVIGEHDGALLYTVGERHGFTTNTNRTHYVVSTDVTANTVTVSDDPQNAAHKKYALTSMQWVASGDEKNGTYSVQTRYREAIRSAVVHTGKNPSVEFQLAHVCAAGQECVLYDGDRLVGSAVIAGACA